MDRAKNQILTLLFAAVLLISASAYGSGTDGEWRTLSSYSDVRQFKLIRDTMYVATSGGMLVIADPTGPGQTFDNLNGLGTVDISDVVADASGQIWVAGFGRIVKFAGAASRQFLFLDNDNKLFAVSRIVDDGDHLWVGTRLGLVLFSKTKDGGQIEDSYGLFGSLTPFPDVSDIWLRGDTIWLATSAGLAVANKRVPNLLKSPLNWTTFDMIQYPSLASDRFRRVVQFESDLYVATSLGAYRMGISGSDTTFLNVPFGQGYRCSDLRIEHDSLFVYSDAGLAVVKSGTVVQVSLPGFPAPKALSSGSRSERGRWVSVRGGGVLVETDGTYQAYPFTGMPTNDVAEVMTDRQGVLTTIFSSNGAARYANGEWALRQVNGGSAISAMSDSSGSVWFGTFGGGLWHLADSGAAHYTEANSTLRSVPENSNHEFIVVTDLANDGHYLYATCFRGRGLTPVAVGDLRQIDDPSRWTSLGFSDGVTDTMLISVDCWDGYVVVGSEGQGVFRCYVGPDPFVKADDSVWHYTAEQGRLRSDIVRVVKFSNDGDLWVGTNFGLSRFDPLRGRNGLFVDVDLPNGIGPDITDLEFDSRGNLWISAHNGLALRDAVTGRIALFTTLNSGLVADDVRKVSFDRVTGKLYAATGSGVSVLSSLYGNPTDAVADVVAFPNPFVVGTENSRVEFNYSGVFTLMIFTTAGDLVRETSLQNWDGRSQSGELVASGVYLYVLSTPGGLTGRGKILLIRQ